MLPKQNNTDNLRNKVEELMGAVKQLEERQQRWEEETTCKRKLDKETKPDAKTRKTGPQGRDLSEEDWDELMRKLNYNFSHVMTKADRHKQIFVELIEIQGENKSWLTRLESRGPQAAHLESREELTGQIRDYSAGAQRLVKNWGSQGIYQCPCLESCPKHNSIFLMPPTWEDNTQT